MKNLLKQIQTPLSFHRSMLFACLVFISSCKKNSNYDLGKESKLVVLAEITAGDSAYIPISKSLVPGNGNPVNFEKINNASVTLTAQNSSPSQLRFNNHPDFSSNPASIYSHPAIFKYSTEYTLKVEHPELGMITASTKIPAPVSISNVKTDDTDLRGREVLQFSFDINDNAGEKNYYVFEAVKQLASLSRYFYWNGVKYDYDTNAGLELYENLKDDDIDVKLHKDTLISNKLIRLSIYTSDPKSDNAKLGRLDSSFNRVFITDSLFSGQAYRAQFSIAMDRFIAINSQDKGIVMVRVKSVDKDFYNYLLQYEKYKADFGTMPEGQLNSPVGNIKNGLGIFGGSSKKEWKYYYDEFE